MPVLFSILWWADLRRWEVIGQTWAPGTGNSAYPAESATTKFCRLQPAAEEKLSMLKRRVEDPHHFYVDSDPGFPRMRIRIQIFTSMRIRIRILLLILRPLHSERPRPFMAPLWEGCPSKLVSIRNNRNWNRNLFRHYLKQNVCFGCFASIPKQRVSMFWLNRNKQKTNRNSLIGSIFCDFYRKFLVFSVFFGFFLGFFGFFLGLFGLFRNSLFRCFGCFA